MMKNLKGLVKLYLNPANEEHRIQVEKRIRTLLMNNVGETLDQPDEPWFTNLCSSFGFYVEDGLLQQVPIENLYPRSLAKGYRHRYHVPSYILSYIERAQKNHGSILMALNPANMPSNVHMWLGSTDKEAGDLIRQEIFARGFIGDADLYEADEED